MVRLMFLIIRIYTDDYSRCFRSRGGGEASYNNSVNLSISICTNISRLLNRQLFLTCLLTWNVLILGNVLCVELMESTWNDHFNCSNIT